MNGHSKSAGRLGWGCAAGTVLLSVFLVAFAEAAGPTVPARSDGVWRVDLRAAWQEAQVKQRPLLLFVSMPACGYCRKMKQTTLKDRAVLDDLRNHFVAVALDRSRHAEYIKRLQIRSFPTTVIIHPNGTLVDAIKGYQAPRDYRKRLDAASRQASSRRRIRG